MKPSVFLLALLSLLYACKKEEKKNDLPFGTWKVDNAVFHQDSSFWTKVTFLGDTVLYFLDTSQKASISFSFKQKPETGTYKIVYEPNAVDEVRISSSSRSFDNYSRNNGYTLFLEKNNGTYKLTANNIFLWQYGILGSYSSTCSFNLGN